MKLNKLSLIVLGIALLATACVKDQEKLFSDSASARLVKAMEAAQKVLTEEPGCWLMEYYPQKSQAYGGYVFFLKFTDTQVTAWSEIAENAADNFTSLYKITNDSGPVLSFDEFNYLLHRFSTPSGSSMRNIYGDTGLYQGYEGDFEFLILKATADEVLLKGKRSGCVIRMTPFEEDQVQYLNDLKTGMSENFKATVQGSIFTISAFSTTMGNTEYKMEIDRDMRQLTFTKQGSEEFESRGFMYTPTGIKLYKPYEADGASIEELDWDKEAERAKSGSLVIENRMPEGWIAYERYIGTYELTYNDDGDWYTDNPKTVTVTLEQKVEGESYIMKGVSDTYDVEVKYDLAGGNLVIMGQIVSMFGENSVYFAAMYAYRGSSGAPTWTGWRSTKYGIKTKADPAILESDPEHFLTRFVAGPSAAGKPVNSFGLLMQKPDGTSGGWMRPDSEDDHKYDPWFIFGDNYYTLFWKEMVKK